MYLFLFKLPAWEPQGGTTCVCDSFGKVWSVQLCTSQHGSAPQGCARQRPRFLAKHNQATFMRKLNHKLIFHLHELSPCIDSKHYATPSGCCVLTSLFLCFFSLTNQNTFVHSPPATPKLLVELLLLRATTNWLCYKAHRCILYVSQPNRTVCMVLWNGHPPLKTIQSTNQSPLLCWRVVLILPQARTDLFFCKINSQTLSLIIIIIVC